MVGSFYFLLHSWLAGIAGRNKLLINMKGHLQRCAFCFAFIWFRVQGSWFMVEEASSPLFLLGRCLEVAFKSPVTSHSYDTREGIVSHMWHEILRRSPHLFWLGLFTHRAFSSAQDDDTRGRMVSSTGGIAACLEDGIPVSQPFPLGEGALKGRIG